MYYQIVNTNNCEIRFGNIELYLGETLNMRILNVLLNMSFFKEV